MTEPEKMELTSMSITEDQKAKLKQVFPEVFNEDKIDFDKLRRSLGDEIDEGEERFGMIWPGKNDCFKVIQQPSIGTLKPAKDESVNWNDTENLFIEGDNLEVLKLLQRSYYGKVKMIYIDPPYNTGAEFVYPDKYSESLDTYLAYTGQTDAEGLRFSTNTEAEGRFHSKWMNMMYSRLYLARNLLRGDGILLVSIDFNEINNLRSLCDEVFGEENFIESVIWKKRYGAGGGSKGFAKLHEYILVYSKTPIKNLEAPLTEEQIALYNKRDEKFNQRGGYVTQPLATSSKGERSNLMYTIIHEASEITPKAGSRWLWSKGKFDLAYANNEIVINKNNTGFSVRFKQYLRDINGKIRNGKPLSIKSDIFNQEGTKEVADLLGKRGIFEFPKPSRLLEHFFSFIVNDDDNKDGIYLDFFSGSCTSAHAVLNLNKEDNGNRNFIMMQLPEPCDDKSEAFKAGYKTIADIGKERIRRVIKKIEEEQATEAKDAKGALPGMGDEQATFDLGFKVFKLDKSNFNIWDGTVEESSDIEGQLKLAIDHIDPDSNDEDILYELLLKSGFELTTTIQDLQLAGKKVYSVADNALLICLDRKLTKEVIAEMARLQPARVVCLDAGFADNDQLKTNAVQIMKSHDVEDFRTV